jgi:hypothetical protein
MGTDIKKILEKIEAVLKRQCPKLYAKLLDGIGENEVREIAKNLSLPADLITLYNWHNGIEGIGEEIIEKIEIFNFGIFLPLEVALWHREYVFDFGEDWEKDYFPVFSSTVGDYYLMNINNNSDNYGNLFFYSPALLITEPEMAFEGLAGLFISLTELYEDAKITYTETKGLKCEAAVVNEVFRRNNKQAKYWRL